MIVSFMSLESNCCSFDTPSQGITYTPHPHSLRYDMLIGVGSVQLAHGGLREGLSWQQHVGELLNWPRVSSSRCQVPAAGGPPVSEY